MQFLFISFVLLHIFFSVEGYRGLRLFKSSTNKILKGISCLIAGGIMFGLDDVNAIESEQPIMQTWVDKVDHYSIEYPTHWTASSGVLSGERTVTAFVSPSRPSSSISVVVTPIPADFTRLTSFGDLNNYLIPRGEGVDT